MMKQSSFIRRFGHALQGLKTVFLTEQSFRLHVFSACVVLLFAFVFQIKHYELIVILLLIAAVFILEIINSIIERIVDAFKPRMHPIVKDVKDIMASAVLLMSVFSALIGFLIFYPYILLLVLR
ncbi:MAG: diacylglycerol kinase family protein [Patescibacteria group bacterium]